MVLLSLAAMLGIYASLFVVTLRLHSLRSSSPHPLPMSSKDFHLCHVPFQVKKVPKLIHHTNFISVLAQSDALPL
jgi:hypothetical protein